jgi:hypothetical protein
MGTSAQVTKDKTPAIPKAVCFRIHEFSELQCVHNLQAQKQQSKYFWLCFYAQGIQ